MTNSSALVLLIGGNEHVARAQSIMACSAGAPVINACDLMLDDALALLHYADLFVGTNSGPMNLAAAVATPAFALFGVNPVLAYSRYIHAIEPEGENPPTACSEFRLLWCLSASSPTFRFGRNVDSAQHELGEPPYDPL